MKGFVLTSLQQSGSTNVIPQILVIHAISGCDTVAASYGIGKLKAMATSNKGFLLDSLGVKDIPWDSVENEATKFMIAAYGGSGETMSECCKWIWAQKTAKSSSAPQLCTLAPTTEAFRQNAKRAHFQCGHWYAALDSDPLTLDPKSVAGKLITSRLTAITLSEGVCLVP